LSSGAIGLDGAGVNSLAVSGTTFYAGGRFATAGGTNVNYVAQWTGRSWLPLGSGMNGSVSALAVAGSNLYAGGEFTMAGDVPATNIAQWNGISWSPVGTGVGFWVYALAVSGSNLYVAGVGNAQFTNVAQWNGSTWTSLGSGMNGAVSALATSGTNLYAGGFFTQAGGANINYLAQWNGTAWSPVGSGISYGIKEGGVLAMAVAGTNLYVGGLFTMAGNTAATNIAQWDGAAWSPVGPGITNNLVSALAVSGGALYAGGYFATITDQTGDSVPANCLARWDGSNWSPIGSGVGGGGVTALAAAGHTLYVGGSFTFAGGQVSPNAAIAVVGPPTILTQPADTNVIAGSDAGFTVSVGDYPLAYQWIKNGSDLADTGNLSGADSPGLSLTNVFVNDPGYYQVIISNVCGSVTSIVASLTISNLPLVLPGSQCNLDRTNKQFRLTVAGPAGSNVVVYASTNLQSWVPLGTSSLSLGSLTITDMWTTNYPARFYRAKLTP